MAALNSSLLRRRLRPWQRLLSGLCLLSCCGGAQATETVQALRYGVTLFHFYQQDYFDALTELMAAQQLQALDVHAGKAELLRAGMSLSYGMDRVAEQVFTELLTGSGDAVDRDKAWFYLAKLAWQRGELERARMALGQMAADYSGQLAAEADYLRASIALREGNEQLAASYLERLPQDSPWLAYHYYNLGAVQANRGDWLGAVQHFRRFDELELRSGESKALRDKAYTASGFALMAAGEFDHARDDFTRVRLDSPMADRALLGYGWTFSENGDYRAALSPWQALGERSLLSDSVRESLLAVPYAYEQLGRHALALDNYRAASDVYAAELAGVRAAIEVFRHGDLEQLLQPDGDNTTQWLAGESYMPLGEHVPYLSHLISRHSFQLALRELRDLRKLAWHLAAARERLQVLAQVDADQQQTWSTVIEGDRRELLQQRQQSLQAQVDTLRRRLDQAQAAGDSRLLADAATTALWQRLDRADSVAGKLAVSPEQRRLLELYRGLLLWQDSEAYPARSWQLQRQVQKLETLAQQAEEGLAKVDAAVARHQQSSFSPRIDALQQRVQAQNQQVQLALNSSQDRLRQVAVTELERQALQLTRALGQSRLAVARLYDLGSAEVPR